MKKLLFLVLLIWIVFMGKAQWTALPVAINPWSIYPDICYGDLYYPLGILPAGDGKIFYSGRCSGSSPHSHLIRHCLSIDDMHSMTILNTFGGLGVGTGAFSTDSGNAFAYTVSYEGLPVVNFTPDNFNTIIQLNGHHMPDYIATAITDNYVYSVFNSGWDTYTYIAPKSGPPFLAHINSSYRFRPDMMQFLNDSKGFNNGYYTLNTSKTALFRTDNSGEQWYPVFIDSINVVRDYQMLESGRGYLILNTGTLFMSEDYGETWSEQGSLPEGNYYSIRFMNDSSGYAGGQGGELYKTMDYGLSWTNEIIPTTEEIRRIYAYGDIVYVVTNSKNLFKNTNLVGIRTDMDLARTVELFPNPCHDQLTVNINLPTHRGIIAIYSLTGQKVLEIDLNQGSNQINVRDLNNGLYLYKIFENNTPISSDKLVILR